MAHKHTAKRTVSKSSSTTPGTTTKSSNQKINYKKQPKGTPAGTPAQVSSRSSTNTSSSTPTLRQSYVTYQTSETSRPTVPTSIIGVAGATKDAVTPNQSPLPQGKGELVFAAGFGLLLLAGFTDHHIQAILDMIMNGSKMKYTKQQARVGMVVVGGELLFLIILTTISEASDTFSNVALALIFGLFLVWGINNAKTSSGWVEFITGKSKKI